MLHLTAFDEDDLPALSAQMQDAVLQARDIQWIKSRKLFALTANRFAWDSLPKKMRRRAGLRFNHVTRVRKSFLNNLQRDGVLSVLAITFTPGDGLGGTVLLTFSGGHRIALDVECIDAQLDDLGPVWGTSNEPNHDR